MHEYSLPTPPDRGPISEVFFSLARFFYEFNWGAFLIFLALVAAGTSWIYIIKWKIDLLFFP